MDVRVGINCLFYSLNRGIIPESAHQVLNRVFSHILKTQKWQKQAKSGKNAYF
jgi:hypothetical protein